MQLAARSGLSHSFLSQLERGRARPSILSLEKIARALGTSQLELIAAANEQRPEAPGNRSALVRAGDGTRGQFAGGEARMLTHGARRFQPMEFTADDLQWGDFYLHDEDEFVHVTSGVVEVDLGGLGLSVLREGDSLYYVGGTPHRWRAVEPGGFRLFVVKEKPENL